MALEKKPNTLQSSSYKINYTTRGPTKFQLNTIRYFLNP